MRLPLVLLTATLAAPAFAQAIAPAPTTERAAAAVPYQETAACVVKNNPRGAKKIFAETPGTDREKRMIDQLFSDYGCREMTLYSSASTQEKTIAHLNRRGFLAEAMLKRERPDFATAAPPPAAAATAPITLAPAAERATRDAQTVQALGRCLVATDWTNARAVLATPYASPAEPAAIAALKPAFTGCVAQDFAMKLHPLYLRSALAEAAWRAYAPAGA